VIKRAAKVCDGGGKKDQGDNATEQKLTVSTEQTQSYQERQNVSQPITIFNETNSPAASIVLFQWNNKLVI